MNLHLQWKGLPVRQHKPSGRPKLQPAVADYMLQMWTTMGHHRRKESICGFASPNFAISCLIVLFMTLGIASAQTTCSPVDRDALLSFKGGALMTVTNATSSPCLASWTNSTSCCAWTGVSCDNSTGHVVTLNLTNCALDGTLLPGTLGNVAALEVLDLSNNNLNVDFIDASFGDLTSKLTHLDLGQSFAFEASATPTPFPSSLCRFRNLTFLSLRSCNLRGSLPLCLGSLSGLQSLDLSGNDVRDDGNTSMLEVFGNLTSLQTLTVDQVGSSTWSTSTATANVSGSLFPISAFSRLRNLQSLTLAGVYGEKTKLRSVLDSLQELNQTLQYLNLRGNALSGMIPHSIKSFQSLRHLDLGNNSLEGTLTSSLFQLGLLEILNLDANLFEGAIPSSIGNLGRLQELNVTKNYLSGAIPEAIGQCVNLTFLDLSSNSFNGSLPKSIGNLRALRYLSLLKNRDLGGDLPEEIANLTRLEFLDVSHDSFTGTIPESWGQNLKRLEFLHMTNNRMSGVLPLSLGNLTSLISLDLSYNGNITGPLPRALGNLKSGIYRILFCQNQMTGDIPPEWNNIGGTMKSLSLYDNLLSGTIPNFTNYKMLEVLDLSYNQLRGPFPAWVEGSRATLRILELSSNKLAGPLPPWLPTLTSLQIMNLGSGNAFTGNIPEDLSTLTTLTLNQGPGDMSVLWTDQVVVAARGTALNYDGITINIKSLDFNHNQLGGHIPTSIGSLQGLLYVSLAGCNLTGTIPPSLGNLTNLNTLDLSSNALAGAIPQQMADNLVSLQALNLSNNNLSGPIPQGKQFASFNASAFANNPLLCGPPSAVTCEAATVASAGGNAWEDVMDDSAFAIGVGLGFAVMVLIIWFWLPARQWVLYPHAPKDVWYGHFKQLN